MSDMRYVRARPGRAGVALVALAIAWTVLPLQAQHTHGHGAVAGTEMPPELAAEIEAVRRATERYVDHANAVADGYTRFGSDGQLMGGHWFHPDLVQKPLDLERPSTLQYANIDGRMTLVGVAYTVYRSPGEPLPEGFSGSDDVWHVHDVKQMAGTLTSDRPLLRFLVDRRMRRQTGDRNERTLLTMLHAWVWLDNPAGLFAQHHLALPYLRAGLLIPENATLAASSGVSLLAPDACRMELRRVGFIARLSDSQHAILREACSAAANDVRAARNASDAIDPAAEAAWRRYERIQASVLTREQEQRLESMIEHPGGMIQGR